MVFPEKFLWGVSISGFQFDMGGPSKKHLDPNTDWFMWVHDSKNIQKGLVSGHLPENGVNYWSLYEKDHDIAVELGLNTYRIGIEWSRVFSESTRSVEVGVERASDGNIRDIDVDDDAIEELDKIADEEAVNHYRAVIDDLRTKDFKVFVCLNHFTLPLWIHDPITVRDTKLRKGPRGWVDEETAIEFTKYAAYSARELGDLVDSWATFNEPMIVAETGYLTLESGFPPGLKKIEASKNAVVHMAVAHARAYDALKRVDTVKADEDSSSPADVGLIHNVIPVKPLTEKEIDAKAAQLMDRLHNHFFIQSATEGRLDYSFKNRKEESKSYMRDRLDWLGVNYYTRFVVSGKTSLLARLVAGVPALPDMVEGYGFTCKPRSKSLDGLPTSDFGWEIYPRGIVDALNAMKEYRRPMYITENGVADAEDALRPRFIADHLKLLDRMISDAKIDLRGYLHWSLTDNYEWAKGFSMKFGLFDVDLKTKKRTAKKSAKIYRSIIETGEVTEALEKRVKRFPARQPRKV
ncbi:MAG: beta-galactosidase BgaS [Candidatus Bathyarchaeota archaeon]|nr:beta-galactosidase BgaS [Candidatus Bathyarchaeota archaeon]